MDLSKLSIVLLEAFCALSFVACGVVVGVCLGFLLGPPQLTASTDRGVAQLGLMLNGAIFGAALGIFAAVISLKLSRARRQVYATSALGIAAVTSMITAIVVKHFSF